MGDAPKPPKQPVFLPIDIPGTLAQALQFDTSGYADSDAQYAAQFPGLVKSRTDDIQNAYKQLAGPLDPTVQNTFTQSAITKSLAAFGSGNNMTSVDPSGASGNAAAVSLANSVQQKQDYDWSNFQSLIASNPQRAYGLSGNDALSLLAYNQKGGNVSAVNNYNAQLAGINAQGAYGVQTGQAIAGLGSIFGSLSGILSQPTYQAPSGYGSFPPV